MINLAQKIEEVIHKASVGAINLSSMQGNIDVIIKALTVDKNDYEQGVLFEIPDKHSRTFNELASDGDFDSLLMFSQRHGEMCSESDARTFEAAILLYFQSQFDMAQTLADRVYANRLRMRIYPKVLRDVKEKAYKNKMVEVAEKPRNKNYDAAVTMLRRTWERYPGASKKALFKAIRNEFNGGVSEDSLRRWANAAGLGPEQSAKRTSFSLVRD